MTPEQQKIEMLVKMAERLTEALDADIAALEKGRPKNLRMVEPEMQRLSVLYSREVKGLSPEGAKATPLEVRKNFVAVTNHFRDRLDRHMRLLKRVRNASEGIIRAVAEDAERRRTSMRPYGSPKMAYRPPPGALVYNSVV